MIRFPLDYYRNRSPQLHCGRTVIHLLFFGYSYRRSFLDRGGCPGLKKGRGETTTYRVGVEIKDGYKNKK